MVYQCADHYVYEIVKVPFPHTGGGGRQELGVRSEKFSGGHGRVRVCARGCVCVCMRRRIMRGCMCGRMCACVCDHEARLGILDPTCVLPPTSGSSCDCKVVFRDSLMSIEIVYQDSLVCHQPLNPFLYLCLDVVSVPCFLSFYHVTEQRYRLTKQL